MNRLETRIACLHLPCIHLDGALKASPHLEGTAFAVARDTTPGAEVLAASPEAIHVEPGCTVAQVLATSPGIVLVPIDPCVEEELHIALLDLAKAFSPKVYDAGADTVLLDIAGMESIYPTEDVLVEAILERAGRASLRSLVVGTASTMFAAEAAAKGIASEAGKYVPVPEGMEQDFLAHVPVSKLLDLSGLAPHEAEDAASVLRSWGIKRSGDLASLPAGALADRLGKAGLVLHSLARGERDMAPHPCSSRDRISLDLDLDPPAMTVQHISSALEAELAPAWPHPGKRTHAARAMEVILHVQDLGIDKRRQDFSLPITEYRTVIEQVCLEIEADPPSGPVARLQLLLDMEKIRTFQLDLFDKPSRAETNIGELLAKLDSILGRGKAGGAGILPAHTEDRFEPVPLQSSASPAAQRRFMGRERFRTGPVLRLFVPPLAASVIEKRGRPSYLEAGDIKGRILSAFGPFRLHVHWWSEQESTLEEWDVELERGRLLKLVRRAGDDAWIVRGEYD